MSEMAIWIRVQVFRGKQETPILQLACPGQCPELFWRAVTPEGEVIDPVGRYALQALQLVTMTKPLTLPTPTTTTRTKTRTKPRRRPRR